MNTQFATFLLSGLLLAVLVSTSGPSHAAGFGLRQRLFAPDAAGGDEFGDAIALRLPYMLVGASKKGTGRAYFFWNNPNGGRQPWEYVETIFPSVYMGLARFGSSVAWRSGGPTGPNVAVGAPFASTTNSGEGAVFLFYGANGHEHSILTAPVPRVGAGFGAAVSMSHNFLAVGAPFRDSNDDEDVGAIYLYEAAFAGQPFTTSFDWQYLTTRLHPQRDRPPNLGFSLASTNEFIVAGAPALGQSDPGGAVILGRNTGGPDYWGVLRVLDPPDPDPAARFGWSVAVDGDLVAVGARNVRRAGGLPQGAVYLFGRNEDGPDQWGLITRVVASDAADYAGFGSSVALSGNILAVGAPVHPAETGASGRGAVYLYEPDPVKGWREVGRITAPRDVPDDELFGINVALEGTVLAAGAVTADSATDSDVGAVTVVDFPAPQNPPHNLIVNGSFSEATPELFTGGLPDGTGYWKGPSTAELAVAEFGITPLLQTFMLKFAATGTVGNTTTSGTCALYQLVDLTPYADHIATGRVVATLSYAANRVAGDAQTDDEFQGQLRSYNGDPANFPTELSNHTGSVTTIRHTDDNPAFWETLRTELPLPAGTTYVAARISALENERNDIVNTEFDGHYADRAALSLRVEPPVPEIVHIQITNGSDIRIRYTTESPFHYSVQRSTNLRKWTTVCWGLPGSGNEQKVDIAGGMIPDTFYRVVAGW